MNKFGSVQFSYVALYTPFRFFS